MLKKICFVLIKSTFETVYTAKKMYALKHKGC